MESKFKVGDRVRIVKYGHLIWANKSNRTTFNAVKAMGKTYKETKKVLYVDIRPEHIGKETVITKVITNRGKIYYGTELFSYVGEGQLELIEAKSAVRIQTILYKPSFRQEYWKQEKGKSTKISKSMWMSLYDHNAEVLPPLTKSDKRVNAIDNILLNDKTEYKQLLKKKFNRAKKEINSWVKETEKNLSDEGIDALDEITTKYEQALIETEKQILKNKNETHI